MHRCSVEGERVYTYVTRSRGRGRVVGMTSGVHVEIIHQGWGSISQWSAASGWQLVRRWVQGWSSMSQTVTCGLYFHSLPTFIYRVYYYSRSCD
jgi:hypothetical protein